MSTIENEDAQWLAGLFEGEGTTGLFSYKRKEGTWRISTYFLICNNDPILINEVWKIANYLGVNMAIYQRERPKDEDWNLNYQILCKNMKGIYKMLETVLPYMRGSKRSIAEMTMRFIESRNFGEMKGRKLFYSDDEWGLYGKVKELNQRGRKKKSESSETLRDALDRIQKIISGEDKVQTSLKIGEEIPL